MNIVITGIDALVKRMENEPKLFRQVFRKTLEASLLAIWQNVGERGYPTQKPGTRYVRTGTLGRTLGSSETGGMSGRPSVYKVETSARMWGATFGTRLNYAPWVIGKDTQTKVHAANGWWTLDGDVKDTVEPKIIEFFQIMADSIARYLDGK